MYVRSNGVEIRDWFKSEIVTIQGYRGHLSFVITLAQMKRNIPKSANSHMPLSL